MWNERRRRGASRSAPPPPQQGEGSGTQTHGENSAGTSRRRPGGSRCGRAANRNKRGSGVRRSATGRPMTEEERATQQEHFDRWWTQPEDVMSGDSSPDVSEEEEQQGRREGKRTMEESNSPPSSSPPSTSETDSDFEVTDSNTYCTLYKNGNYVAHKEEALLPGIVEKVGVRVKLEWRKTYASVWIRRAPDWFRFPKSDYPIVVRPEEASASTSRDIVPRPISVKRKFTDRLNNEDTKKMRLDRMERRKNWVRRYVLVESKGTQTDEQVDGSDAEVPLLVAQGCCTPFDDVAPLGVMDEVENIGNPDLPFEEDCSVASDDEELKEAKNVIILGWKDALGAEDPAAGEVDEQSGENAASAPHDTNRFDISLRALIDRIMENFDDLDADEKFMTHLIQKALREQAKPLEDDEGISDSVNPPEPSRVAVRGHLPRDRPEHEAMQACRDATLLSLHERILRLKREVRMMESAQGNLRNDADVHAKKMKFFRLVEEWEVVIKEKKDSLIAEMAKWDDVMDRLARDAEEMKITDELHGVPPPCITETVTQPATVLENELPVDPAVLRPAREAQAHSAGDSSQEDGLHVYGRVPAAMEGIFVMKIPSGPDGQLLGAPRSPGPDSRLNNIITQIYEKMEDPESRPRALGQPVVRFIRQHIRDIRIESNRAARRNKCRALRDYIMQIDGVVDFFGGLLDQLLSRAEEEARRAQEVNEDPLPFFSFGLVSGSQGTSFDDTSTGEGGSDVNWSDEGCTFFERRSSDDHGSSSE
ncbi:hypothetical protein MLD38_036640 [Melastoma candidum]|uniref:Uncharacterized protein n=1 Tax=Melastoma candidum TaxID=119954 RepID=A0ACB9LJU4_9MYRT|nr:hypothetical protein MLD38_036640 [Melastoma candidum]